MLIGFSLENFRSVRDRLDLSLIPAKAYSEKLDTHTVAAETLGGKGLLRGAMVMGPNCTGKTNLLMGLAVMRKLVLCSLDETRDLVEPFFGQNASCRFEVSFLVEGIRHRYGFTVSREGFHSEWLYAFPHGRQRRLILREDGSFLFSSEVKRQSILSSTTSPEYLVLTNSVRLNQSIFEGIYRWFKSVLAVYDLLDFPLWETLSKLTSFTNKHLCHWLNLAGIPVESLILEPHTEQILVQMAGNGDACLCPLNRAGQGLAQLIAAGIVVNEALSRDQVLVLDDLSSLHPTLVEKLVGLFHSPGSGHAQLIFGCRNPYLISTKLFRRDQIWFMSSDKDLASELPPLSRFKPRKKENLVKGYLSNRFGNFPEVSLG